ncbi:MAG TPA: bifunctional diaminohydroxyphosphoribosylaminopyrimidine deaminase/5-amino-6-(5-phosphoribosylamino)uracil reductase RibD [Chloroflexi bacterium]|nr:bifunctional diaminohydroxyphosphoribosylaminopyrimidine deaminase/5-amino-6-(5-phosphoribosylamino)uracil reductase RibD [Chloroflexota bacterium]
MTKAHEEYMEYALGLAVKAQGRTSPNPMVGAVLVKDGHIVGEGFTNPAGGPHAEIVALTEAGKSAKGSTVYVTLEPCAHYGRTGPCADALIAAGVKEVYSAIEDPNPDVNGKGHARLRDAGIPVHTGISQSAAAEINKPFFKYVVSGQPWVTAKFAVSLDGKIATNMGESQWITGEQSRQRVHHMRNVTDAILVGAGTVLVDNPNLTTRLQDNTDNIRNPLRIVVDSSGRVSPKARVYHPDTPGNSVLATTSQAKASHCKQLESQGVKIWNLPEDANGRVNLNSLLDKIGEEGMLTLLVEGGSEILGAFVADGLMDQVCAFFAPIIIGGKDAPGPVGEPGIGRLTDALHLSNVVTENIGDDILVKGDVVGDLHR